MTGVDKESLSHIGAVLKGKYRLDSVLGSGGVGGGIGVGVAVAVAVGVAVGAGVPEAQEAMSKSQRARMVSVP